MARETSESTVLRQWERLETYRERYRIDDRLEAVLSLQRSMNRRRLRAAALTRRLDELLAQLRDVRSEIRAIDAEIEGSAMTGALLIEQLIDEIRTDMGEAWSPSAVRGFRVWRISDGRVLGNQVHWPTPRLTSTCLREVPGDDIPHAAWRCGPPACGIYAVKTLDMFPGDVAGCLMDRSIVGVVALSGKVVEHESGYRGQHGTVVALSARQGTNRLLSDDREEIEAIFDDPVTAIARLGVPTAPDPRDVRRFLESNRAKEKPWI
jgi:hypothetical protein